MTLVHRNQVQNEINLEIQQNESICKPDACQCFEPLMKEVRFVILSHRWGGDELSFEDFSAATRQDGNTGHQGKSRMRLLRIRAQAPSIPLWKAMRDAIPDMPQDSGFTKLAKLCEIAASEDCKYAWLDTVCINKESSAELEESIRSMFGWYRNSHLCVVHLGQTNYFRDMDRDQWFRRGWTLQELLAPPRIHFFTAKWERITLLDNDKLEDARSNSRSLLSRISKITRIPMDDLTHFKPGLHNIRQRLSWASHRQTTRMEDMAYCLIGIFDVSIPVAYGEKEKAFYRLQVELIQRSNDRRLFDWHGEPSAYSSMLAVGPKCFPPLTDGAEIKHDTVGGDPTYTLTNFGLRMKLMVYPSSNRLIKDALESPNDPILAGNDIAILSRTSKGNYLAVVLQKTAVSNTIQFKRLKLVNLHFGSFPDRFLSLPQKPAKIFVV